MMWVFSSMPRSGGKPGIFWFLLIFSLNCSALDHLAIEPLWYIMMLGSFLISFDYKAFKLGFDLFWRFLNETDLLSFNEVCWRRRTAFRAICTWLVNLKYSAFHRTTRHRSKVSTKLIELDIIKILSFTPVSTNMKLSLMVQ